MPSIDVEMVRSLRGGVWEILSDSIARGLAADMSKRNIIDDTRTKVNDFKTAISSWDNCMAANFCKWPVIAIIVVGGLILLGIITCIQKYLDAPYNPEQGYKTQAPMQAPFPSVAANHPPTTHTAAPPQYAEFDVSRKGGEDALPVMPSWDESANKKVLVHEEEVEMDHLKKPTNDPAQPLMAGSSSSVPTSPMPMEHPTAYGQQQTNAARGYASPDAQPTIPFTEVAGQGPAYGQTSGLTYPQEQSFNAVPPMGAMGNMRSQSPAQSYRGYGQDSMNQSYGQMPAPGNGFGNQGAYGQASRVASPDSYGMQRRGTGDRHSPMGGPAPYGASPRQSPAPQNGRGYGAPGYNAARDNFNRAYSPAPERQYGTPSPRPMNTNRPPPERMYSQSPPHSPITNNSGFDFTSGFARPQEYDRRPSESREPAGQEGYPGYKPYNRPQDGWSGI
ncbi:hypothetical protein HJFPF1_00729 [Paramyrothecium foliicola]|nr:hypothetical protein HJFPF1_00729 [Paramyrothecium foliicola]